MNAAEFGHAAREAFATLEADLGFQHIATTSTWAGHTVLFRNPTTDVAVNSEAGVPPWVEIAEAAVNENPAELRHRIGLDILLIYLRVHERPSPSRGVVFPSPLSDHQAIQGLSHQAALLLQHGKSLLVGDFSLMAPVEHLAQELAREAERALYSSSLVRGHRTGA